MRRCGFVCAAGSYSACCRTAMVVRSEWTVLHHHRKFKVHIDILFNIQLRLLSTKKLNIVLNDKAAANGMYSIHSCFDF